MAIPKLALIPSGVKAGKLYSVLPTNGDGDFTTTRNTVATRVNENGLIEEVAANVPRLDYSDGTCPSLLLEPTATNLVVQSQVFSGYSGDNEIVTDNQIVSPDGTVTGALLADSGLGGSSNVQVYEGVTVDVSSTYTYSVFAKKKDLNFIALRTAAFTTPTSGQSYFDLNLGTTLGVATGHTSKIENYGNGWYRCSITFDTDAVVTTGNIFTRLSQDGTTSTVDLDNTSNVYIWGFQFEKNSYATSYIKTIGTTQSRSADTANGAGNASTFNDSSGVLMAEISALADDGTNRFLGVSNGSLSNRVNIIYNTSNELLGQIQGAGSLSGGGVDILSSNKIALKYKLGDNQLWVNGIKVDSNTSTLGSTVGLNVLDLSAGNGSFPFYGSTKQIQYFDSALNDSDLEKLTSWTSFTAMANGQSYTII